MKETDRTGNKIQCITFSGAVETLETANVFIDTPYFTGNVLCCILNNPVADLTIGNIKGINDNPTNLEDLPLTHSCSAQTGQILKTKEKPITPTLEPQQFNCEEFKQEQQHDPTLKRLFKQANMSTRNKVKYITEENLLYRINTKGKKVIKKLVTPTSYRTKILKIGHDSITSRHLGSTATLKRIAEYYTWPGMTKDVRDFVKSCHTCKLASEFTNNNAENNKASTDRKRLFQVGDKVLVLLTDDYNNLETWKGPFTVSSVRSEANYEIWMRERRETFNANRLKPYITRKRTPVANFQQRENANFGCDINSVTDQRHSTRASITTSNQRETWKLSNQRNYRDTTTRKRWKYDTSPSYSPLRHSADIYCYGNSR